MPYEILTRTIKQPDGLSCDDEPTTTWRLECVNAKTGEIIGANIPELTNDPLVVALNFVETNLKLRRVGQDGPNKFILYRDPPRQPAMLRNC